MLFVTQLMVMVFCFPYFNDVGQHNDHLRFDVSFMHHNDGTFEDQTDHNEHKEIDHDLVNCLTTSCVLSSLMVPDLLVNTERSVFKGKYLEDIDLNFRSLYLSGNPPVPRGGFSNT